MMIIALTSANEAAMSAVADQLLAASTKRRLQLSVLIGVKDAQEAQAVYAGHGELWRVGEDSTHPELDMLIDREIDDTEAGVMHCEVNQALEQFLGKTRVAA